MRPFKEGRKLSNWIQGRKESTLIKLCSCLPSLQKLPGQWLQCVLIFDMPPWHPPPRRCSVKLYCIQWTRPTTLPWVAAPNWNFQTWLLSYSRAGVGHVPTPVACIFSSPNLSPKVGEPLGNTVFVITSVVFSKLHCNCWSISPWMNGWAAPTQGSYQIGFH